MRIRQSPGSEPWFREFGQFAVEQPPTEKSLLNPAPVILEILSGGVMAGNKSYANPIDPFPR